MFLSQTDSSRYSATPEFLTEAGFPLFKGKIREAVAFQKAANEGALVHQVSDRRARIAWNEYCAIGKEVFGE